jgi:uncharacterized protein involved in exopolysaccharide biosynthesis
MVAAESDLIQIPISKLWAAILGRRRWIAMSAAVGMLVSAIGAFLLPNEFSSTAQLMPVDQQAFSNVSQMNPLTGSGISIPTTGGGSLLSQRTPDATAIGVLSSSTVQNAIINRFDLRRVYGLRLYTDAREALARRTKFDEDKKTGIVSITVEDRDRYRARDIAQAYIDELEKLISSLSASSARREREFLEERLKSIKGQLDTNSVALSQFSSRNATLDIQRQGDATVAAAARVQSEVFTAEAELSALKASFSDDNVRVRATRARIGALQNELRTMAGKGDGADLKSDELIPSVRQLPLLGLTYYKLSRQVNMDETLYEALTKQYELARVQEAKDIPVVGVLAAPEVAEKKSSPRRGLIVIGGMLISAVAVVVWIVAVTLWKGADESSATRPNGRAILYAAKSESVTSSDQNSTTDSQSR